MDFTEARANYGITAKLTIHYLPLLGRLSNHVYNGIKCICVLLWNIGENVGEKLLIFASLISPAKIILFER